MSGPTGTPQNNFDFLRFCLASAVILSHCFPMLDGSNHREPLYVLTGGRVTLGSLAVDGFFTLSGFLILQSWLSCRGLTDYLRRRALRICPGFAVASLVSILLVGLLGTRDRSAFFAALAPADVTFRLLTLRELEVPRLC